MFDFDFVGETYRTRANKGNMRRGPEMRYCTIIERDPVIRLIQKSLVTDAA